jgi:uncharacterized ferritin-like protein (DUF455 family)
VDTQGNPTRFSHANLFARALHCLSAADVAEKLAVTAATAAEFANHDLVGDEALFASVEEPLPISSPGRPLRPRLVAPRQVPQRGLGTAEGRAALVHAVAHIEFNAINLAWDAVYRFRGMPPEYYRDWIGIAADEARHFSLLQARLRELGHDYGDFDAHDGLWEMAVKTSGSCLQRMALVPRVLEARGLDVTPGIIDRLRSAGDPATVAILELILREEVAHVAAGSRWFAWCCARAGVRADATFAELIGQHMRGAIRGPFNIPARLAAGFTQAELSQLEAGA